MPASSTLIMRRISHDDRDLGFKICTPREVRDRDGVARPKECIAAPLIDERIGLQGRWRLSVSGFAHQHDVVDVGRAIDPGVGTRKG